MKKNKRTPFTTINFYCIAILIIIFCTIGSSIYSTETYTLTSEETELAEKGYKAGSPFTSYSITVKSKFSRNVYLDSVFNSVTGKWQPSKYKQVEVLASENVLDKKPLWLIIPTGIMIVSIFILLIYSFLRLILNINRKLIFDWKNVKILKRIGVILLIAFVMQFSLGYLFSNYASSLINIPGYETDNSNLFEITFLIMGIMSLIFAEIFAIGLKMKEEQDLTV